MRLKCQSEIDTRRVGRGDRKKLHIKLVNNRGDEDKQVKFEQTGADSSPAIQLEDQKWSPCQSRVVRH